MKKRSNQFELMTLNAVRGKPSLEDAARQIGVGVEDLDSGFGIVPIDPEAGKYAVQVRAGKVRSQPRRRKARGYQGPWSNPKIAPFGPPK
jgi:hypothetical protein